jgi:hypothetical protein
LAFSFPFTINISIWLLIIEPTAEKSRYKVRIDIKKNRMPIIAGYKAILVTIFR